MQRFVISVLVIVMMCSIGLQTHLEDFAAVFKRPGPLLLAVLVNIIVMPLVAVLLLSAVDLPEATVVGLTICAASPAGSTGPLFAMQAGGHLATSVAALVALSLLSVVSAPPTITWALGQSVEVNSSHLALPMMGTLALFQMLPLLAGMAVRRWREDWAERLVGPGRKLAGGLLLLVVLGLLASKGQVVLALGGAGALLCIALVLLGLGLGALVSCRGEERRSYALITGVRNISLALLISASYFPDPGTDAAILTFGLFTMVLPFLAARLLNAQFTGDERRA